MRLLVQSLNINKIQGGQDVDFKMVRAFDVEHFYK